MNLNERLFAATDACLAELALRAGMPENAGALLTPALQDDHADADTLRLAARAKLAAGDARGAVQLLDRLDTRFPELRTSPEVATLRASALARAGESVQARDILIALVMQFPDDARLRRALAAVYLDLNDATGATAQLRELIRLNPSDSAARVALTDCLSSSKPGEAADILAGDPTLMARPHERLREARLLAAAQRFAEAEMRYRDLLALAPNDATLHAEAGRFADTIGDLDAAVMRLTRAAELTNRTNVDVLECLAVIQLHKGNVIESAFWWWRVTRSDAQRARAWAGLLVCALASEREQVIRRARQQLGMRTTRTERQRMVAELWCHAAGGLAAIRAIEGHVTPAPATGSPLAALLVTSIKALEEQTARTPERADHWYHLASLQLADNDAEQAGASVEHALTINPRYAAAQCLKADADARVRRAA